MLLVVLGFGSTGMGAIIAEIVRVGYPTVTGAAIRSWSWMPVVVDLRLEGESQFSGYLRLRQFDRDGDAFVDIAPVHLVADTGAQQRYVLYTVANPSGGRVSEIRVELLRSDDPDNEVGELATVISGGKSTTFLELPVEPMVIPDDDHLILYLSNRVIGKIRYLSEIEFAKKVDRLPVLSHVAPSDLPGRWIGLQMLDTIVWDQADATELTPQQQQALYDWVTHGGTLVLAAARTSDTLVQSEILSPLLPVSIGPVQSTTALSEFRSELMEERAEEGGDLRLKNPIAVVKCQIIDDPTVKTILHEPDLDATLVASRLVGKGRVVFVGAELSDLLKSASRADNAFYFYQRILELRQNSLSEEATMDTHLYRHLEAETAFAKSGAVFVMVALLFTVGYVLLSTLGAWRLLQSRNSLKHSWTALAVAAGAASLISIVGVQAFHGVGRRIHQLSIVDGVADSVDAWGTAYFGVTTGTFAKLDVWLPQDPLLQQAPEATPCFLQPLGQVNRLADSEMAFTDPAQYLLRPSEAVIDNVSVRATLKQFEGRWSGALRSTVAASIRVGLADMPKFDSGEKHEEFIVKPGSWLLNGLESALKNCKLIISDADAFEPGIGETNRQLGLNHYVLAIPVGDVKPGERVDLYRRLYTDSTGSVISYESRVIGRKNWPLHRAQKEWASAFQRVEWAQQEQPIARTTATDLQSAILLLTTQSDLDPAIFQTSFAGARPRLTRARCRQFDLSNWLTRRTAILVGFADEPGPIRLAARTGSNSYDVLDPENGHAVTAYRFLIPLEGK